MKCIEELKVNRNYSLVVDVIKATHFVDVTAESAQRVAHHCEQYQEIIKLTETISRIHTKWQVSL